MIKAEGIEKVFGTYRALKDINLSIEENEIFGLLGPSGAGKTTLINILIGQMNPSSGKSEIYCVDSRYLTDEIYEDMGMVLDKTGLYGRLTAKQNLNVYADIHNISKEKIDQLLKKVGLEHAINIPVMKLSKGMKQRLTIALILHVSIERARCSFFIKWDKQRESYSMSFDHRWDTLLLYGLPSSAIL